MAHDPLSRSTHTAKSLLILTSALLFAKRHYGVEITGVPGLSLEISNAEKFFSFALVAWHVYVFASYTFYIIDDILSVDIYERNKKFIETLSETRSNIEAQRDEIYIDLVEEGGRIHEAIDDDRSRALSVLREKDNQLRLIDEAIEERSRLGAFSRFRLFVFDLALPSLVGLGSTLYYFDVLI